MDNKRFRHVGWRNVTTGRLWVVPPGAKPAEYDVGPEWEPIYVRR